MKWDTGPFGALMLVIVIGGAAGGGVLGCDGPALG